VISEEHFEEMKLDSSSDESNYVTEFIEKFLVFEKKKKVRASDLMQKFDEMCRMNGFNDSKLGRMKRDLKAQLLERKVEKKKLRFKDPETGNSKVEHGYSGVSFKPNVM
jgi:hypothetical protein